MRHFIIAFAFLFLGLTVLGCHRDHQRVGVSYEDDFFSAPSIPMGDAGPTFGDAGPIPVPDAGTLAPDTGSIVIADAGIDSGPPPEPDAGSDAGSIDEPDTGPVVTLPCDGVDVPADGSGRVIVRVEGGGDMTVASDTDFVAFSVTIENHMLTSVSAGTSTHGWTLSADCSVAGLSAALVNECDAANHFHPTPGSCGGGACGYSCAEIGPVFASGTSTRFTAYAHARASGTFGLELGFESRPTWITFRDELGNILTTDVVDGDESTARPVAIITVP